IFKSLNNFKKDQPLRVVENLEVKLISVEKDTEGKALLKIVMRIFLLAGDSLLVIICINIPSTLAAQRYQVVSLYK
ncbi:hypothetical protein PPACK8108_LOCUS5771, partial [Phakopsora pachyrhizi]